MTIMKHRSAKGMDISGPAPMKVESVKSEDGEPDGRHVAAQDIMAAFHEKSAAKLMESLASFIDLHGMKPGSTESE